MGGITETVSRNRLTLKFGLSWAEALEITSIHDVLDFVGRSIDATLMEKTSALSNLSFM